MTDPRDTQIEKLEEEIRDISRDRRDNQGGSNNTIWILLAVLGIGGVGYLVYTLINKKEPIYDNNGNIVNSTPEQEAIIQEQLRAGKLSIGRDANGKIIIQSNTPISLGQGLTIPAGVNVKKITSIIDDFVHLFKKKKATTTQIAPITTVGAVATAVNAGTIQSPYTPPTQPNNTGTGASSIPMTFTAAVTPFAPSPLLVTAGLAPAMISLPAMVVFPVKTGSPIAEVRYVQDILVKKFWYNLVVDGLYGAKTIAAVKDLQSKNKIAVDGLVGKNTFSVLVYKK